ncbi:hypothetical protein UFOVP581_37 [uncultured Caudovirales phage]|uniref:Uncharacterized protein n=1 Tax=uncultured Caudovirales phage TaxID=2100421 RepID=A0A6J5PCW6_9CAUD|nr:hypothetical protein UFOVP581_37 [uncultured Caudovirales phage]
MFDSFFFGLGLSFGVYAIITAYMVGVEKSTAIRQQQAHDLREKAAEVSRLKIDLTRAYEALSLEQR